MEETLRLLYLLQKVDSNLDDVEETKGDLPETIKSLEEEIAALTEKANAKQQYIDEFVASRNNADNDIRPSSSPPCSLSHYSYSPSSSSIPNTSYTTDAENITKNIETNVLCMVKTQKSNDDTLQDIKELKEEENNTRNNNNDHYNDDITITASTAEIVGTNS